MAQRECEAPGCTKLSRKNGGRYCTMHAHRMRRWGSLEGKSPRAPEHYAILSRIIKTDDCWLWDGYHGNSDYAVFQGEAGKPRRVVHRIIYGYYYGEVAPDMHVDHMCGNRGCVNPHHLRAVTPKQNAEHFVKELRSTNTSGVRGVSYDKNRGRWRARVESSGRAKASYHLTKDAAEAAVLAMRLEMHTHNDKDRVDVAS